MSVLARAPYGYRYVGRSTGDGVARFEVVADKAEVVRQIFRWVGHEHLSLSGVCQRLLEAGVPSPSGNVSWSRSVISAVLANSAYAGEAIFGKRTSTPWRSPRRPLRGHTGMSKRLSRQVPAPPEQWISIPVPALIERELFERVQEQLADNRCRMRERLAGGRYLLQGLLVCRQMRICLLRPAAQPGLPA